MIKISRLHRMAAAFMIIALSANFLPVATVVYGSQIVFEADEESNENERYGSEDVIDDDEERINEENTNEEEISNDENNEEGTDEEETDEEENDEEENNEEEAGNEDDNPEEEPEDEEKSLADEEMIVQEPLLSDAVYYLANESVYTTIPIENYQDLEDAFTSLVSGSKIELALKNDIELDNALVINGLSNIDILFSAENEAALIAAGNQQRHIIIENCDYITLDFKNVVIDGEDNGGGIYAKNSFDIVFDNITVLRCKSAYSDAYYAGYGGAVLADNSRVKITSGLFKENESVWGGAIAGVEGSELYIQGTQVMGNKSYHRNIGSGVIAAGGGIMVDTGSYIETMDSEIVGNKTSSDYMMTYGGGIYAGNDSHVDINHGTVISKNIAYRSEGDSRYGHGGGIAVSETGNLTFSGNAVIGGDDETDGNLANKGGGIYYATDNPNELVLPQGLIIKNNESRAPYKDGGGVYLDNRNTLIIDGAEITHNTITDNQNTGYGGGIRAGYDTNITMKSGKINSNCSPGYGSGIYLDMRSIFIMESGEINYNRGSQFGGYGIAGWNTYTGSENDFNATTLILNGGEINYNTSESSRGAVFGGIIELNGVTIHGNRIEDGRSSAIAGRYVTMTDGYVTDNYVDNFNVYGDKSKDGITINCDTFTMTGGEISGNGYNPEISENIKARGTIYAASVNLYTISEVHITGGIIKNNLSGYGGVVCHDAHVIRDIDVYTTITGGTFENNEAVLQGGAVHSVNAVTNISGDALFKNNKSGEEGGAVYFEAENGRIKSLDENHIVIDEDVRFENNISDTDGGAVYVYDLEKLAVGENVVFTGNKAEKGYVIDDEDDIALHEIKILTDKFSSTFEYGYNNYDINYTKGTEYEDEGGDDGGGDEGGGDNGGGDNGGGNQGGGNQGGGNTGGGNEARERDDKTIPSRPAAVLEEAIEAFNPVFTDKHIWYVTGYPDGSFQADSAITRAEIAVIFFNLIEDSNKYSAPEARYGDVDKNAWYYQAVSYLQEAGIMAGYPDGTFKPDENITRAELATVSSLFFDMETGSHPFRDIDTTHWANQYIANAYQKGWISGYPDGTFGADKYTTRAEAVTMINSILDRHLEIADIPSGTVSYSDLDSSHWAFADIIEASHSHEYNVKENGSEHWTDFLSK